MTSQSTKDTVIRYFDGTFFEYNLFIGLWKHHGLHYGYYDETYKTPWEGMINTNRVLTRKANIQKGMRVLDAGCGIGGSSVWLAKNNGARVTGITLSEKQRQHAVRLAKKYHVEDKTEFFVRDYCDTKFPAHSFDRVWGLESVCYAENKQDFLNEAFRILKPGGRIIVADGFVKKIRMSKKEQNLAQTWMKGWAIPTKNPATVESFASDMKHAGFQNILIEDATDHVREFSLWLYTMAKWALPIMKTFHKIGIFSNVQINNGISAYLQYFVISQDLWAYMIYQGEKK